MSSINSHPDIIRDWEGLLEAAERNPDVQPSIEEERQSLVKSLAEVQEIKARQEQLTALRQEATQQLAAAVTRGKEAAIRIRSMVRGKIGPKNERLVHFKVAPLRKRPRRPAAVASAAAKPVA
jgi:pantothenate synthetase